MSWRIVKLGCLIENFSVRAKDYGGSEGLDFFGVSNEEGIIKTKYAAEDKAEDYKIIEKGCFAYNPYRVNVGSIGLVTDDFKGLISPAYVVFKPKPNKIIPELLFKFLKSDEGLRQIRFYGRGTVRQALRFEDLCNIELSIPDYPEQEKLFNKLINSQDKSNILSAEFNYQLNLVKKLRQQLLQDAVQGKLVPQNPSDEPASRLLKKIQAEKQILIAKGKLKKEKELPSIKPEEIPFKIPENWAWTKLGDLVESYQNGISSRGSSNFTKAIVLRLADIKNSKVDLSDTREINLPYKTIEKHKLVESDILITRVNGSVDLVGNFNYVGNTILSITACDHFIRMRLIYGNNTNFIYLLGKSNHLRKSIESQFKTTSGQKTINQSHINNLVIPIPPFAEQYCIVQKLNEVMQSCDAIEASIKESAAQNEKLLQQVLREALRKDEIVKTN